MMIKNIKYLNFDVNEDLEKHEESKPDEYEPRKMYGKTIFDLQNAIITMTSLFPEKVRPTREETETFNYCLK